MAVKRVEGVADAEFSYELGTGSVTFDPLVTSPEQFLAELTRMTGFVGTVRETEDGSATHRH